MTIRSRARTIARRIWPGKPKPLILMYHRIADEPVDHWGLAVTPAHFEEQLQVLRRVRRPFSLADFVHRLREGTLPMNAIAVTFDDGYVDNLVAGKPRLAAADVPATVFLATGYLDKPGEFWWDELTRLVLLQTICRSITLVVRGRSMTIDLGDEPSSRASRAKRQATLMQIWNAIRALDCDEREAAMAEFRSKSGATNASSACGRAMTSAEVQALVGDRLVTIGAHTVTHRALSRLGTEARQREIVQSKLACEALAGTRVSGFSYPYGDFDDATRGQVRAAGFSYACATMVGPATVTSDIFALPRLQVLNWGGDAFERALRQSSGW